MIVCNQENDKNKGEDLMQIKANKYNPNEVFKFIRESTGKKQEEFGKDIGRSRHWVQSNELGRTNFMFKDLLALCEANGIDIYIVSKDESRINEKEQPH